MSHEGNRASKHAKYTSEAPHLKRASELATHPAALRANPQAGGFRMHVHYAVALLFLAA